VSSPRAARVLKLLEVFYLLEAGAFLFMAPWSHLWVERVVSRSPLGAQALLHSAYFRGFIAGIGLLHVFFALRELSLFRAAPADALARMPSARPRTEA
jgi:hypothetical protein